MSKTNGGELLVRTLAKAKVKTIFALHGAHVDAIFQGALKHGLRLVDMRHEAAVGHAAEGYSRTTRKLGVAVVTSGAGVTNVISSMANAMIDRTPVLYIAGAPSLRDAETNTLQCSVDHVALAKPITKWAHQINRAEDIPRLVAQAIRCATSMPMGPVFLNLPMELGAMPIDDHDIEVPDNIIIESARMPAPDLLKAALVLLAGAKRPALMIGSDVWYANAGKALREFVEKTGIPVFSDFAAHGLLPDSHPLYGGTFHKLAYVGKQRPDVVLALGLRFSLFTLGNATSLFPLNAKLIHVDTDAVELGRLRRTDVAIVADPKAMLDALNAKLANSKWKQATAWIKTVQQARIKRLAQLKKEAGQPKLIHPFSAVAAIAAAAKAVNAIVVADGAEAYHWLNETIAQEQAGSYLAHSFLGCMGIGLGLSIGAQIAHPKRPVLLMVGDGAIGFNIAEFDSMVRHQLPIVVVVMNNNSWGASEHYQEIVPGLKNVGTRLGNTRYHDVAKGFGCEGVYVDTLDALAPAIAAAFASGRPSCINVRVDRAPVPPELGLMMSAT